MTDATIPTFAPKRAPWFKGVFALLIITLLAYGVMVFVEVSGGGQTAAVAGTLALPQVEQASPVVAGMQNLTQVLHVPGGYTDSNYEYR